MKQIGLLSKETIDKIAAGEVVERPSSVVKELVENAVDAGANAITIEIREGGTTFIRITDNGEGIPKEQIRTAFLRHATSKIRTAEDLLGVSSLGFRGEALSSISAVSQMELITKTPGSLIGSRYLIEGGEEKSFEEIGAPEGSTFLVKNLFYNTPARKKFLKSAQAEAGQVSDLIEHLALSHPEISFKLIIGGATKLHSSGNGNLKDLIYSIYGREAAKNLIPIKAQQGKIRLDGFIGKPMLSRGNRKYENYFVCGRYVRSDVIAQAIEEGYQNFMMQHRYPFTVLRIDVEGDEVDVNVHPAKMEVRFADNQQVHDLLCETIRAALSHRELIPSVSASSDQEIRAKEKQEKEDMLAKASRMPEPFEKVRRDFLARSDSPYQPRYARPIERAIGESPFVTKKVPENPVLKGSFNRQTEQVAEQSADAPALAADAAAAKEQQMAPQQETKTQRADYVAETPSPWKQTPKGEQAELFDEKLLTKENLPQHRMIGQLFDTYWLIEFKQNLYIVDQHAAHEKVMYERLCKKFAEKTFTSQRISPPMIVTLSLAEETKYQAYQKLFTQVGFEIESFGGREYAITAVPDNLYGFSNASLFTEMLDTLSEDTGKVTSDALNQKLATMACKAAVKGNTRLSVEEADALIRELLTLENPYNCPHGRPTIISMSKYEIEKKFKRIV